MVSEKKHFKIKRYGINRYIRIISIFAIIILISIVGYFALHTSKNKLVEKKTNLYSYVNKAEVGYKIFLLPNIIYNQKSIPQGGVYITDFTDYIDTSFRYIFEGERPAELKGKYNIIAVAVGIIPDEKSSKTVWEKQYELQPWTNFEVRDNKALIEKELPIKLAPYNTFADEAVKESEVGVDVKLTVIWNVSIEGITDKGIINEQLAPTMEIPLRSKYYEIKGNLSQEKEGAIEKTEKNIMPRYSEKMKNYYIMLAILMAVLVITISITYSQDNVDAGKKERNKIFSQYNDSLVAFNGDIDMKGNTLIKVDTIEDMVKISDDLRRPILYNSQNNIETLFYVIDRNVIYMFRLPQVKNDNVTVTEDNKNVHNSLQA